MAHRHISSAYETGDLVKSQLSKHTVVQEERLRAQKQKQAEEEQEQRHWLQLEEEERKRIDVAFDNEVIKLEAKYKVMASSLSPLAL